MSHFTVLVIGDNWEGQLEPYRELDLSQDDMSRDSRAEFQDRTDEIINEYNTQTTKMVIMPDGRKVSPYDDEFKVLVNNKSNFKSYEHKIPEGLEVREVPFNEIYKNVDDYAREWHDYSKNDKGRYGYYCNPNAKWDWYSMGGRWSGFFKLKENKIPYGKIGTPGVFGNKPEDMGKGLRADQALKGDIDFVGMREDHVKRCLQNYDEFHKIVNGREVPVWKKLLEEWEGKVENHVDFCRKLYHDNEVIKDLRNNDFYFDEEQYLTSRFEYAKKCQDEAVVTYALLKDGKWYQRGQMGWWGMASDEKDQDVWNQEFTKIVDSLPDDTMLTVVDCHI